MTLASVIAVSCEQTEKPTTATGITLKVDKDVIKCDGTDAATGITELGLRAGTMAGHIKKLKPFKLW